MSERHPLREANDGIEQVLHLDSRRKLRIVAAIDVVKGSAAVAAGLGLLRANAHALENGGASLLRAFDIDPSMGLPRQLLMLLHAADAKHGLLTLVVGLYALLRFVEAYGLWFQRNWARWLGIATVGVYVPFELAYLLRDPGWTSVSVLAINLIVLWLLWPRRISPISIEPGNA
ncbi:DUF2127 domain-containing protein [Arenimonas sp.]|uniref:DUF7144 family membrane protein n=1 Tax=Arenimonas sp. TaxID=1872635 RepID=UPI0039E6C82A